MKTVDKPWGKEEFITVQKKYMVKRLHMTKGKRCSLQYHKDKIETVYVLSGLLFLCLPSRGIKLEMKPGDFYTIMPGEIHRMEGGEDTIYLESSTPEVDDVVRVEDDYDR